MKILHLVFHPDLTKSRVNKTWMQQIAASGKVTISRDVSAESPNFSIDVAKEQELLLAHDRIVIQFPFYWYSVPPILKKWFDDVLAYNFAYGSQGDKLAGKELQLVVSAGGPAEAYAATGFNHFTMRELLRPIEATASLSQMKYLPPMSMHRAMACSQEEIEAFGENIVRQIDRVFHVNDTL